MLQNTFIHIGGIGEKTEQRLWRLGIRTWGDLLDACVGGSGQPAVRPSVRDEASASIKHYEAGQWSYFEARLPGRHKWRAFGDLGPHVLYVDIETTGLGREAELTVVGTFDGRDFRSFVAGRDLPEVATLLESHPLIVTFNGATFDMPILRAHFPHAIFNHVHVDLRYPLRSLGYSGGLKHVEDSLGITRSEATRGLDGWDAVRLWRAYERGSQEALDLLLEYNREDVLHLQLLMELVYRGMSQRLGFPPAT